MKITVEYLRTSTLDLCYSDTQLQTLVDRIDAGETPAAVLLSLPVRSDAIRVLCGLLSSGDVVVFAKFAASRAAAYASAAAAAASRAAAYASAASRAAAHAADYAFASRAAAYASAAHAAHAASRASADADAADQETSIRYGLLLLGLEVA